MQRHGKLLVTKNNWKSYKLKRSKLAFEEKKYSLESQQAVYNADAIIFSGNSSEEYAKDFINSKWLLVKSQRSQRNQAFN